MPDYTTPVIAARLEKLTSENYPAVKQIYEEGIATGLATLATSAPVWENWDKDHLPFARSVAFVGNDLAGWAALSPVSGRCVYSGVAEISVYIGTRFRGLGIGKKLLQNIIQASEENGIWTLQAGIMKENFSSLALHQSCRFRIVGLREKLGKLHNEWRDIYLLERRSTIIGV